jgi:hypothetical protein
LIDNDLIFNFGQLRTCCRHQKIAGNDGEAISVFNFVLFFNGSCPRYN